jgi:hypothetical protein
MIKVFIFAAIYFVLVFAVFGFLLILDIRARNKARRAYPDPQKKAIKTEPDQPHYNTGSSGGGGFRDHYPEVTGQMGVGRNYDSYRIGYDSDRN